MQQGVEVCKSCHSAIHDLIPDEKELGRSYNMRPKLLAHPLLGTFGRWIRTIKSSDDLNSHFRL